MRVNLDIYPLETHAKKGLIALRCMHAPFPHKCAAFSFVYELSIGPRALGCDTKKKKGCRMHGVKKTGQFKYHKMFLLFTSKIQ